MPQPLPTELDPRWRIVLERDAAYDGQFVYSVKTTGVYCRPSCPGRHAKPQNVAFHATCEDAERAGFRACKRCRPSALAPARVAAYDWAALATELDNVGCTVLPKLLTRDECRRIAALYPQEDRFRSQVHMARHGFGRGEYRYFKYPLPDLIDGLRGALYPRLAPIANAWNARLRIDTQYPANHADFLKACHAAGQRRSTPLLLQYGPGDFNCLHQDLYGDLAFPLQVAVLLSEPHKDFTGGEFALTEQRPRMQSRVEVVPLTQGDAVAFAVHHRPVRGSHGDYRVNLRHGVSRLRSGLRHTLGIIFHDAK
ncbi:MAG TPA: 2OG-Fe(II) oxygenase [Pseudolabrys sp.]|nr:2OG-Fe(II) oxygenase [Pseudolabrys sp.]